MHSPDGQEMPALHVSIEGALDSHIIRENFAFDGGSGEKKKRCEYEGASWA